MANPTVVFVIDDDELMIVGILHTLKRKAREIGIEIKVKSFSDTRLAREALRLDSTLRPVLYICDMRIPGDMDGPEALFYFLKERGDSQHLIYMTGHLSEHDEYVRKKTGTTVLLKSESLLEFLRSEDQLSNCLKPSPHKPTRDGVA